MAQVNPLVLVVGSVREVEQWEFVDRASGVIDRKGRLLTVLTRAGFMLIRIPRDHDKLDLPVNAKIAVWVSINEWEFQGRRGVSYMFNSVPDEALLKTLVEQAA